MNRRIWSAVLVSLSSSGCALVDAAADLTGLKSPAPQEAPKEAPAPPELPPAQRAAMAGKRFAWDLDAVARSCVYENNCTKEEERQRHLCEQQKLSGVPDHPAAAGAAFEICRDDLASHSGEQAALTKSQKEKKAAEDQAAASAREAAAKAAEEATTELPRSVRHDNGVEREIAASYRGDGEKVLKVLVTPGWAMIRASSGVVTGRALKAYVATREKEGCRVVSAWWLQDHDGSSFSGPVKHYEAIDRKWIACAKVR